MKIIKILILSILIFIPLGAFAYSEGTKRTDSDKINAQGHVSSVPTPTTTPKFTTYKTPEIIKKREYTIVMLGDSMTHALGPHGGPLYERINALYKDSNHGILVDNYAGPSTNILTLDTAMNTKTTFAEWTFEPLLSRPFDLILIESFGYNPLSQLGIENGIKKQNEELEKLMNILTSKYPNSAIVFVATIAPNKVNYGKFANPNDPPEARAAQADERIAYIKNHIEFAKSHNIPLINIFEKSLTPEGDGNLEYINPTDYIHPSAVGLELIGSEIAKYIYDNQILPN